MPAPFPRWRPWVRAATLSTTILSLAHCADDRRAVVVTPQLDDELRAQVERYALTVTLDGKPPTDAPPSVAAAQVPFTLVLPKGSSGSLTVDLIAEAADGEQLAAGQAALPVTELSQDLAVPLTAAPVLRAVTPPRGPQGGGIPLVLEGARFTAASHVSIAGADAGEVKLLSQTQLALTLPPSAGALGPVPVRVTATGAGGLSSERADLFSYYAIGAGPGASLDVPFPREVLLADLNGDKRPDLVVASAVAPYIEVRLGNGDGTFQAARGANPDGDIRGMVVADLDLDGKPDLVLANGANRIASVLRGLGDGSFGAPTRLETDIAEGVAVGDLDQDGRPDIAVANVTGGGVSLILNKLTGFQPGPVLDAATGYQAVAIADLDRDGRQDLAIARNDFLGNGGVVVMLGQGGARFGAGRRFATAGDGPQHLTIADLDQDGKLDVVAALLGDTSISVLRGVGDGTLGAPTSYAVGQSSFRAAVVDYDRDGRLDIVAPLFDPGSIAVLVGNGDGTFHLGLTAKTPPNASSVGVGDVNGDGRADLAVNYETGNKVTVLLNTSP